MASWDELSRLLAGFSLAVLLCLPFFPLAGSL